MKIIAIEGLDKSGKHTVAELCAEYLEDHGLKVVQYSFPNYDGPIGMLIHDWLRGRFEANTQTFELLQAADKQMAQDFILDCEKNETDVIIMDRYLHSMWAYGAYDNDEAWLQELSRYMRKPDHVIYLDVEPEISMRRRGEHGDNDYYESDLDRLAHTRDEYRCLFKEHKDVPVTMIDANQPLSVVKIKALKTIVEYHKTIG